jgi:ribonuclease HI
MASVNMSERVELFTDGACLGNPGPGGWAALLRFNDTEKELSGGEPQTTNNRMEMRAVIEGLRALTRSCSVRITTDSQYVLKGMTEWIDGWKRKGWRTADKKPVKNADLWQQLDELCARHQIEWIWVRGHDGHIENERVDQLACTAARAQTGT